METIDTSSTLDPGQVSYRQLAIRYGAIWGAVTVLMTLVGYLTDSDPASPATSGAMKAVYFVVGTGVAIWAVVAAIRQHRDRDLGGFISLGRAVMLGMMIGLVAGAIGAVFMLLYTTVINPDFAETMKDAMQAQWEAQGMSDEQIEMASSMSGWIANPVFLFITQIIGGLFNGLIIGLIAGAIMKKDRPYA